MGYFGYILGRRGPSTAQTAKTEPTPTRRRVVEAPRDEELPDEEAAQPKPAAVEEPVAPADEAEAEAEAEAAKAVANEPEPEPESAAPKTAEKPTAKRRDDEIPTFVDEADELEYTMVGRAEAPPSVPPAHRRTIYQPPVKQILYDPEAANEEPPEQASSLFLVHASAQTDKGLRRKTNQDSLLVLEALNLFVVADGMGGYAGGELASELTVKAMSGAFTTGDFEGPPHDDVSREGSELARAIQMANAEIQEHAAGNPELKGMGTTVCAAYFSPSRRRLHIGHVGDSRCYRFREGNLTLMTADHTMAEHGVKGPESVHLSRAVGIWPTVPIDVLRAVPQVDDIYLLCSDGLTKMLPDDVIASVLRAEEELKAAVDRLILFANSKGGKDNISVILVRVVPPEWRPRPSATNKTAPAV